MITPLTLLVAQLADWGYMITPLTLLVVQSASWGRVITPPAYLVVQSAGCWEGAVPLMQQHSFVRVWSGRGAYITRLAEQNIKPPWSIKSTYVFQHICE